MMTVIQLCLSIDKHILEYMFIYTHTYPRTFINIFDHKDVIMFAYIVAGMSE